MNLKCKKCGMKWNYGGTHKFYASCPDCHFSVQIETSKTSEEVTPVQPEEVLNAVRMIDCKCGAKYVETLKVCPKCGETNAPV